MDEAQGAYMTDLQLETLDSEAQTELTWCSVCHVLSQLAARRIKCIQYDSPGRGLSEVCAGFPPETALCLSLY